MKFTPPALPSNPTAEQWKWWKQCFIDGLSINEIKLDDHKLTFLRTHAGSDLFPLLENVTSFADALVILDKQFQTPTRLLYARHQLLSCVQKPDELISDFVKRLQILVHRCECKSLTAQEHKELLLRDSLVAGISSDIIRARLLELNDSHASLDECIALATAVEISTDYSRTFHSTTEKESLTLAATEASQACATGSSNSSTFRQSSNRNQSRSNNCLFCGLGRHQRRNCPARDDDCHLCGKRGHWRCVCRSQSRPQSERATSTSAASVLCSVMPHKEAIYASVLVNKSKEVKALIDCGSSTSFIVTPLAQELKLQTTWKPSSTMLANKSICSTRGYADTELRINGYDHKVTLTLSDNLVADIVIGMDVFSRHKSVELVTGGELPPMTCASLPAMNINPPDIFSSGLPDSVKPISTRSRFINPQDREFIRSEIDRLLKDGIIEVSSAPWRAQAFVVRNKKPRMVIDYSETINLFSKLDAYPLKSVEAVLNAVAENHYFSRLDMKSAYHQIPIKASDRQFTSFEANGTLYQFTRLPFGLTNAVPVFQRIMDDIVRTNNLNKAYPYIDDITICGKTIEEHDKNLADFLRVAKSINLTLNMDKCVFGTTKIALLGHIIEKGTKRPDPDRMKCLLEFKPPTTLSQLKRLNGFFAYYAKWVHDYSNKIKPLLDAQRLNSFPLSDEAIASMESLKADIINSSLAIPDSEAGPLTVETDASGTAVGAVLSQATRPIAFFSRTLSKSEQKMSAIEREAMAIVEAVRKWSDYLHTFTSIIKTDQKSIAYIFTKHKTRIKNDKLARWRLELSQYNYAIVYRKGEDNVSADHLSRIASTSIDSTAELQNLHNKLAHPGVKRFWDYVKRQNLPFTLSDVENVTSNCITCLECKPRFYNPTSTAHVIKSSRPFERLNIDILGPKIPACGTGRRFLMVIIDEYSRFPFAFSLQDITTNSVTSCLKQLFNLFGSPQFVHSDRGSQFMAKDFDTFLHGQGISHSRSTPYNPTGNSQVERYNGVIWRSVKCLLHARKLPQSMWEQILPEALNASRTLLCTVTNESPHDRMFKFNRKDAEGFNLPHWLDAGREAYCRRFVRNKEDPLLQPVKILQVINPHFARIEREDGHVDTVSTHHLSPGKRSQTHQEEEQLDTVSRYETTDVPTQAEVPPAIQDVSTRPVRNRKPPDRLQIQW